MPLSDLKFDYTVPRGTRVKLRPRVELDELLKQLPSLKDQIDRLHPNGCYATEVFYAPAPDVYMLKIWTIADMWFNALIFQQDGNVI